MPGIRYHTKLQGKWKIGFSSSIFSVASMSISSGIRISHFTNGYYVAYYKRYVLIYIIGDYKWWFKDIVIMVNCSNHSFLVVWIEIPGSVLEFICISFELDVWCVNVYNIWPRQGRLIWMVLTINSYTTPKFSNTEMHIHNFWCRATIFHLRLYKISYVNKNRTK